MDRMTSRHSFTALGLPGRLTIKHLPRLPATARLSIASGLFFIVTILIASVKPGIVLSITASVASGVTSRGDNPVPPLVTIRSRSTVSDHSLSFVEITSASSGTTSYLATSTPTRPISSFATSPLLSGRSPLHPLSLITRIPANIRLFYHTKAKAQNHKTYLYFSTTLQKDTICHDNTRY